MTIALHKISFVSCKGRFAILGGVAQSLFVERNSISTQIL
jgi:hypothetical protein